MNPAQQNTLLTINALLGNLLFNSDNFETYNEEQKAEFEEGCSLFGSRVRSVFELENDVWVIRFELANSPWAAWCNLTKTEKNLPLPNGTGLVLRPFETLVLKS